MVFLLNSWSDYQPEMLWNAHTIRRCGLEARGSKDAEMLEFLLE